MNKEKSWNQNRNRNRNQRRTGPLFKIWGMVSALLTAMIVVSIFFRISELPASAEAISQGEEAGVQEADSETENDLADTGFQGQLYAQSAVLMDGDSGRVLYGKEADVPRPMASTTKIMTCILVLEHMEDEQETAEVSEYAASQPKVHLGAQTGESYYVKDLLYSLMLESHNDSAVILAEHVGGSVEGFAALMNEKAQQLGCEDTYFITPNGLDASDEEGVHSTTARDLARIMKYCICESEKKEEFLEITGTATYSFQELSGSRSITCTNHNAFLTMMEGAISGKTGFTGNAGYCYVGALKRDGKTLIVALLACGWPNNKNYKWADTRALMEYGLESYEYRNLWEDAELSKITVKNGIPDTGALSGIPSVQAVISQAPEEWEYLVSQDEEPEVTLEMKEELEAPVTAGETVGQLRYTLDGTEIGCWTIVAADEVGRRDYIWCAEKIVERYIKINQGK